MQVAQCSVSLEGTQVDRGRGWYLCMLVLRGKIAEIPIVSEIPFLLSTTSWN